MSGSGSVSVIGGRQVVSTGNWDSYLYLVLSFSGPLHCCTSNK